jgi:hypothetical protein
MSEFKGRPGFACGPARCATAACDGAQTLHCRGRTISSPTHHVKDFIMNRATALFAASLTALILAACDKPAPVVTPGPAGPAGATGATGEKGATGDATTVIVVPPAASAPTN